VNAVAKDNAEVGGDEKVQNLQQTSCAACEQDGRDLRKTPVRDRSVFMRIAYTPRAASNLRSLQDYIAVHNPTAAFQMVQIIRERVSKLATQPRSGRLGRIEGTRELIVNRTTYIVSYRVADNFIEVLAILHGARRWPESF